MKGDYPYNVYYTYLTKLSGDEIQKIQDKIFEYLEEKFGLSVHSTGYSHIFALDDEELSKCEGMTQDLEFMLLKDVIQFVTWLKELSVICRISYNKWDSEKEKEIFYREVK